MEHKNIRLIIVAAIAFTILSEGCSITVTKNIYNVKPKASQETDRRCAELVEVTTYVLRLDS
ncbi:MAG: hypothetical protein WC389_12150 [Lutibacter sp.]|jgi:capsular polysaccharide biosynthesis protein